MAVSVLLLPCCRTVSFLTSAPIFSPDIPAYAIVKPGEVRCGCLLRRAYDSHRPPLTIVGVQNRVHRFVFSVYRCLALLKQTTVCAADWTGAQIGNNDSTPDPVHGLSAALTTRVDSIDSDDVRDVDLTKIHNLSGPVAVEGAEPGDCLVVDILDGLSPFLFSPTRS